MEYWKFSGRKLYEMAGEVLNKRRATEEACATAAKQLHAAAQQGYLAAYNKLAYCYEKGIGVAKDDTRAMECYRAAADCGDEAATASTLRLNPLYRPKTLGDMTADVDASLADCTARELYDRARNTVGSDGESARTELFCYAAQMGIPEAALEAAQLLEKAGRGEEALYWYRKAALQSNREAEEAMRRLDPLYDPDLPDTDLLTGDQLYEIAEDYRDGMGRPENGEMFERLSKLAAARSNGKAALELGRSLYQKGKLEEAVSYLRRAAEEGFGDGADLLGQMIRMGQGGLVQNAEDAYHMFLHAAEYNSPLGCYHVGECLEKGEGTEIKEKRAVEWYLRAAGLGEKQAVERLHELGMSSPDPMIQYRCGHFFLHGDRTGGQQDFKAAFQMLSSAAEARIPDAYFDLGLMYRDGRFVYDKRKANQYLEKAAKLGVTGAESERKKVYLRTIAYGKDLGWMLLILVSCFLSGLFVVGRLKEAALIEPETWNDSLLWGMYLAGSVLLMIKHYFVFHSYSVRPLWQDLIATLIFPGIGVLVVAILIGTGAMDLFGAAIAMGLSALLTVFLIQHDSVVKDAIWVGLRLIIFVPGSIMLMSVVNQIMGNFGKPIAIDWPETYAIVGLIICGLVLMTKQYYLYANRMEMDNFLVCSLLAVLWPGIFLTGLFYFCWMITTNYWVLVIGAGVGTVLHCLISDNIWGVRDSD